MAVLLVGGGSLLAQAPEPKVGCDLPDLPTVEEDGRVVHLASNVKRPRIRMWAEPNGAKIRRTVMLDERAEWSVEQASLRVRVEQIDGTAPIEIPAILYGTGRQTLKSGLSAPTGDLEIPVTAEWREARVQEAIEAELRREPLASASETTRELFRALIAARTQTVYFEMRTGDFAMTCEYFSEDPDYWIGTVASEPIYLRVRYDGNYLEAHRIEQ